MYNKSYQAPKKEHVENTGRWKELSCSWIGRIGIVKITILLKVMHGLFAILIKIPMIFFTEVGKAILIVIRKYKRLWRAKAILSKNSNAGAIAVCDFKLYYRVIEFKTT
jgi:hypothetical protein